MNELYESQKQESDQEIIEDINLEELNFEQLKKVFEEASELAKKTFTQEENGFRNVNGEGVTIGERKGVYKVIEHSIPKFSYFVEISKDPIIHKGSPDKEVMMKALEEILKKSGFKIIE